MKTIPFRTQNELIQTHLKLVYSIALKFQNRGVEVEDLVQEGNIGLMKAAEKYDHTKGWEFTTYATFWIKQAVLSYIYNTATTIRIPVYLQTEIAKILQAYTDLSNNPEKPSMEQMAEQTGLDEKKIAELMRLMNDTVSLDSPVGEDGNSTLGDLVASEESQVEEALVNHSMQTSVRDMINQLPEKEAEVIRLRFGIECDDALTLEQIGQKKKVTRERIRQIEAKALSRLQHPVKLRALKALVG